jgi:hypothetical protein
MGPKVARSTVLSKEEEAACIVFRRHSLLPLDDCLYALQENIPNLTRSSLHRLFQRHGIGRLPKLDEKQREKKTIKEAAANRHYYMIPIGNCDNICKHLLTHITLPKGLSLLMA